MQPSNGRIPVTDLLVKLYELPDAASRVKQLTGQGVIVRRAVAYDKQAVFAWVGDEFGTTWASEVDVSFANHPCTCLIALESGTMRGFACYDSSFKGFFGPVGVVEAHRGRGIGHTLVLAALQDMARSGYAYAIIGAASNPSFYAAVAGATPIPESTPGPYQDRIQTQ